MKRPPAPPTPEETDQTEALAAVLRAIIEGYGRGGLTYASEKLGMTPSALRKRLMRIGGGFDSATMSCIALVMSLKDHGEPADTTKTVGDYRITTRQQNGTKVPAWSTTP